MGKLKDQLAGVAALVAAIIAIGGGFIKYGEITTKLNALQKASMKVDKVSIEMVTANEKDIGFLKQEIEEKNFREDLYHRLAVILIKVPSLNERREDIPLLVNYFSGKISEEHGTPAKSFSKDAIKLLQEYDWTGNIRELRNVVERLIILGNKEIVETDVKMFASKQ